jgi:hypothetical protein
MLIGIHQVLNYGLRKKNWLCWKTNKSKMTEVNLSGNGTAIGPNP